MKRFVLLLLVFSVMVTTVPALADADFYVVAGGSGVGTPITNVPCTITQPGLYYLKGNLIAPAAANAITVGVNNVTIDLMGFSLSGSSNTGHGILISGYTNLEVRNGTITNFNYGIFFTGDYCRFINIKMIGNNNGIDGNGGNNIIIKGCTVSGGSGNGIAVDGTATISNNMVFNMLNRGITITGHGIISNNTVSNGNSCIVMAGDGSIIGNTVKTGGTGINLSNGSSSNYVMLDQNTASGSGTHFKGGTVVYTTGTNAGF